MNRSKIVICPDLAYAKETVPERIDAPIIKTFFTDEFKVDDAAAVTREAYIAEEVTKAIVLAASTYNIYAQNALLKLLEEPPRNIMFVVISRSKNGLLQTIRSRLQMEVLAVQKPAVDLGIDLGKLDLEAIFNFVKNHRNAKRETLKALIEKLLEEALLVHRIRLREKQLEYFENALELADLNARADALLLHLMLEIYEAKTGRL